MLGSMLGSLYFGKLPCMLILSSYDDIGERREVQFDRHDGMALAPYRESGP